APETQRLCDERPQGREGFLDGGTGRQRVGDVFGQATAQLVPEALVRPVLDLLVQAALDVVAAAGGRAHGTQGEAARMVRIDQLVEGGWNVREQTEPAEGPDLFEIRDGAFGHACTAHTVIAVAA